MLITLLFLSFYLVMTVFAVGKHKSIFMMYVLAFYILNDFIFVQLGDVVSTQELMIIKGWKEAAAMTALLVLFVQKPKDRSLSLWFRMGVAGAIFFLTCMAGFTGRGNGIGEILKDWRFLFVPIVLAYLLHISGLLHTLTPKLAYRVVAGLALLMVLYSVYFEITAAGDYTRMWSYQYSVQKRIDMGNTIQDMQYQFVREGHIRHAGFFLSSIEFSTFCSVVAAWSAALFLNHKSAVQRYIYAGMTTITLYGVYLSHTRVGWTLFVISGAILLTGFTKKRQRFLVSLAYPLLAITATFIGIIYFPSYFDESVLGRLPQYVLATYSFRPIGYGMGQSYVGSVTYLDTWIMSLIGVFGLAAPLYMWLYVGPVRRVWTTIARTAVMKAADFSFCAFLVACSISYIYVLAFQYSINGVITNMLITLAYLGVWRVSQPHRSVAAPVAQPSRQIWAELPPYGSEGFSS